MKKWKRTGSIIRAGSGECAPVVCIASSVEHARLIKEAPRLLSALIALSVAGPDELEAATKAACVAIKRATK